MKLIDTVKLATTTVDGYGDKTVTILTEVNALFIQKSSVTHSSNSDIETADTTIYLDPDNQILIDNMYHLEGMYIIAQPFGRDQYESWYKITSVTVAQRKLLDNDIDNIHCSLQKAASLPYVLLS